MGIFAQEDRFCIHRYRADESYQVGAGKAPVAAYLDIESIIGVAKEKGVDAVHPGYGFLSENADFARALRGGGADLRGAPARAAGDDGRDKTAARALAKRISVPRAAGHRGARVGSP